MPATRGEGKGGGFILIEAMLAALVLSILVLGVCGALAAGYQQCQFVKANGNALLLARQLADEITAKPLADPANGSMAPGPGNFTSRSSFTHVTNYDGYSDSSTAEPLVAGGTLDVTGADVYQRSVTVTVGAAASIDTRSPPGDFAIVTVTIRGPIGGPVSISKLVANYAVQR